MRIFHTIALQIVEAETLEERIQTTHVENEKNQVLLRVDLDTIRSGVRLLKGEALRVQLLTDRIVTRTIENCGL